MRKTTRLKLSVFVSIMLLSVSMSAMPIIAASESQDGLEFTLITDKESYTSKEEVVTSLSVKNTNHFTMTNLSLNIAVPKGFKLVNKSIAEKQIGSLSKGETTILNVSYTADSDKAESVKKSLNKEPKPLIDDRNNVVLGAIIIVLAALSVMVVIIKNKRKSKKIFSLFVCLTLAGAAMMGVPSVVEAARGQKKLISISESVKVGDFNLQIDATVKYDEISKDGSENKKLVRPENLSKEEEYYWNNSKLIDVIDVKESHDVLTEAEVITLLKERGFSDYPITYEYSINGKYDTEVEALETSNEKHPIYQTYYFSEKEELFTIFVINGSIFVNPASFNLESNLGKELLISESEKLTSYVHKANKFYVTIPKSSSAIIQIVKEINAATLDKLMIEEN